MKKNIVFMGTPEFAVPVLEMLCEEYNVVMVVSRQDAYVGRKRVLTPSPVKTYALEHNLEVFTPKKIKDDYTPLKALDIDLIITCAYGQILSKEILDLPKLGCINVHASLLPKYRGSAPIEWSLFNGDKKTGITIMFMDEGMDSGDIIKQREIPIEDADNNETLHNKLSILGRDLLKEVLPTIFDSTFKRTPQSEEYSLAPMIKREMERIDFNNKGIDVLNKIRGLSPKPLANILLNDKEVKVIEVNFEKKDAKSIGEVIVLDKNNLGISCKDGIIFLKKVMPSGKKEMDIKSYLNGINITNVKDLKVN